jgi:hypothetical protein
MVMILHEYVMGREILGTILTTATMGVVRNITCGRTAFVKKITPF